MMCRFKFLNDFFDESRLLQCSWDILVNTQRSKLEYLRVHGTVRVWLDRRISP